MLSIRRPPNDQAVIASMFVSSSSASGRPRAEQIDDRVEAFGAGGEHGQRDRQPRPAPATRHAGPDEQEQRADHQQRR